MISFFKQKTSRIEIRERELNVKEGELNVKEGQLILREVELDRRLDDFNRERSAFQLKLEKIVFDAENTAHRMNDVLKVENAALRATIDAIDKYGKY